MNRAVVTRAAAGLAAYLHEQGANGPVVVGYDARHRSDDFARDTAEVMTGAGFKVWVLPRPLPTPVLAFAIRELGCSGRGDGDREPQPAAGQRLQGLPRRRQPDRAAGGRRHRGADRGRGSRWPSVPRGTAGTVLGEHIVDRYLDTVAELAQDGPRDLDLVYTPLHGVGGASVVQVLETAGFSTPRVVAQQEQPDPDFPTVPFPNPEEPGAMDLAMALAEEHGVDLVVANDPDADRCAAAVPTGHGWRMLRGDEVGALLAHHLMARGRTGTWAASIVSSSLLGRMAAAAGQPYVETLTGFKWISRVEGLTFGYEEALGYCVDPEHVKDKDGVSALLLLCELAAETKAAGRTLVDVLDDIAVEHGLHAHRPGLGAGVRPVPDRAGDGAAAHHAADRARRPRGRVRRRPLPRQRRAAADRRPALPPRRRRAGDRAAQRHRAQAQVLPRGGRPGGGRRGAWTPPGSRPRPGWTRSGRTPSRRWGSTPPSR